MTEAHSQHDDDKEKAVTIIVNGRERQWFEREITFTDVVKLAFANPPFGANTAYTVTYKRGDDKKPEGSMVDGDSVKVKKGMVFNVSATDKS